MGLFNWFSDLFGNSDDINSDYTNFGVNPSTGLPMMDDSATFTSTFDDNVFSSDHSFSSSDSGGLSAFDHDDSSFGSSGGGGFGDDGF